MEVDHAFKWGQAWDAAKVFAVGFWWFLVVSSVCFLGGRRVSPVTVECCFLLFPSSLPPSSACSNIGIPMPMSALWNHTCKSKSKGSWECWEFQNLVVCNFYAFAFFCALLRPLRSFALFCVLWRSVAPFCALLHPFARFCALLRSFAPFLRPTAFRTTAFGSCREWEENAW